MFLLPLLAAAAQATTTTIAPGDDWCTAANAAKPGDEIVLQAGEHAGPCTLGAGGSAGKPVVVRGEDPADPPLIVYERTTSNVIDVTADYVTIRGLAFGPTQPDIDAVKLESGSYLTVEDSFFSFVGGIGVSANSTDSVGVAVLGNTFTDSNATPIYIGCHDGASSCTAADIRIEGNLIDDVTSSSVGYGMELKKDSWGVIRDNVVNDTQGPGIEVFGAEDADRTTLVDGNFVLRSRNNASIEVGGPNVVVTNNIVVGGADGGIYVYAYWDSVHDVIVAGNTGVGETATAFRAAREVTASRMVDNVAWQEDGTLPFPDGIAGLEVRGNVSCQSQAACWVDGPGWNFRPANAALLREQGATESTLTLDFCGRARGEVPVPGAIEDVGPGPLSVELKSANGCPELPDDTGDGDDTAEPKESSGDSGTQLAPGECGCASGATGGAATAASAFTALAIAFQRRRDSQRSPLAPKRGRANRPPC